MNNDAEDVELDRRKDYETRSTWFQVRLMRSNAGGDKAGHTIEFKTLQEAREFVAEWGRKPCRIVEIFQHTVVREQERYAEE